jgi:UDPglucose 6-dehydrogenase
VFDGRNIDDPEAFAAGGLIYEGIGRRSRKEEQ